MGGANPFRGEVSVELGNSERTLVVCNGLFPEAEAKIGKSLFDPTVFLELSCSDWYEILAIAFSQRGASMPKAKLIKILDRYHDGRKLPELVSAFMRAYTLFQRGEEALAELDEDLKADAENDKDGADEGTKDDPL